MHCLTMVLLRKALLSSLAVTADGWSYLDPRMDVLAYSIYLGVTTSSRIGILEPRMATTGEQIGPYTLGICLGHGGFGAVFEATHCKTGQRVAVKLLHDSKQLLPEAQNRFVREVALLKRLDHENIVQMFDAGLHEGVIYCAMELVECGTLKSVLSAREKIPWREAAEVALQVSAGLAHAHKRGCVHRDMKPENLYLAEDGLVKLGDLGLARDLDNERLTAQGETVGTWRYMPPEQIMGMEDIDGRLDLYALGCILFEMISGRVLFDGPNFAKIFDQHLETAAPRLDVVAADCPTPLADLVERMLEKNPADRPENAEAVVQELEQLLANVNPFKLHWSQALESVGLDRHLNARGPNLTKRLQVGPAADTKRETGKILGFAAAILVAVALLVLVIKSCT